MPINQLLKIKVRVQWQENTTPDILTEELMI